jgi:hypothetical protein
MAILTSLTAVRFGASRSGHANRFAFAFRFETYPTTQLWRPLGIHKSAARLTSRGRWLVTGPAFRTTRKHLLPKLLPNSMASGGIERDVERLVTAKDKGNRIRSGTGRYGAAHAEQNYKSAALPLC